MLLLCYLEEIGVPVSEDVGIWSHDWFHHATEERYKLSLLRHARQIAEGVAYGTSKAQPGDMVLMRVAKSRVFNHGAIVTKWPMGIHAFDKKVSEVNLVTHATTAHAEMAVFSPWSD